MFGLMSVTDINVHPHDSHCHHCRSWPWLAEFESARQDRRAVTYTMHPEAIGRGYLASVIIAMTERGRPWFGTHAQIADLAAPAPVGG